MSVPSAIDAMTDAATSAEFDVAVAGGLGENAERRIPAAPVLGHDRADRHVDRRPGLKGGAEVIPGLAQLGQAQDQAQRDRCLFGEGFRGGDVGGGESMGPRAIEAAHGLGFTGQIQRHGQDRSEALPRHGRHIVAPAVFFGQIGNVNDRFFPQRSQAGPSPYSFCSSSILRARRSLLAAATALFLRIAVIPHSTMSFPRKTHLDGCKLSEFMEIGVQSKFVSVAPDAVVIRP
jgi:hypothetical protein